MAITMVNTLIFWEILGKLLWIIAVCVILKYCYGLICLLIDKVCSSSFLYAKKTGAACPNGLCGMKSSRM
jgi:hypothetical protein